MAYRHVVTPPQGRSARTFLVGGAIGALTAALLTWPGTAPSANAFQPASQPNAQPANEPTDPALADFYAQRVNWERCEGRRSSVECATVRVPLDYDDATGQVNGQAIELALLRVPATGTARGSLVVNPGGPGAGGVDFAEYLGTVVDPDIRGAFDIVGFDPRGVAASSPVTCLTGRQTTRWYRTDPTPDTRKERRTLWQRAGRISEGCLASNAQLARFVGTGNTVRDMDIIRSALGETELNWFGFSYGTTLGALYAQRFPERVGRMVLDGGVDPRLDAMEVSAGQSQGFQRAIERFAADCARRSRCVADTSAGVIREINAILRKLDRRSLPTDGSRRLVQGEAITALFFSMYSPSLWQTLRVGLIEAARGDGTTLQILAQLANDQTGPNQYGTNIASAFYAIGCWDYPATPGIPGLRAAATEFARDAAVPELGRAMSWGNAPCSQWFAHSPNPPAAVSSTTEAPILIIGTTFDPATPYEWSEALAEQLPTSRLLTYRGDGHTAYGDNNLCIDDITDRYLLTGEMPQPGTTCTG